MTLLKTAAIAVACVFAGNALAGPSAEEVKELGKSLTPWGAERGGNTEGTIPEYTGGVSSPPKVDYSTGVLPTPFSGDKVQFWIDAKNADQYAAKLAPSTLALIKKYPQFRLAVYPTRRSVSYPEFFLENSIKNATRCTTKDKGDTLDTSKGCRGGIPFPIPKDGFEANWNKQTSYRGIAARVGTEATYVTPSGDLVTTSKGLGQEYWGLYDPRVEKPTQGWTIRAEFVGPARIVGQASLLMDSLTKNERRAWSYQPSSRRVRLAPDFAADTPQTAFGGVSNYDELYGFNGTTERWDFKLLGKKEMYIPYNYYHALSGECASLKGRLHRLHPNPECVRWELHRVWHVQATLKPGKRHVLSKREFFYDEDTWEAGLVEGYDQDGKLYHASWVLVVPDYVRHGVQRENIYFDYVSGVYVEVRNTKYWILDKPLPSALFTADTLPTPMN